MAVRTKLNGNRPKFEEYKGILLNRALYWHRVTGIDLDELVATSNLVFCEAREEWDPERSSFSTFLWVKMNLAKRFTFLSHEGRYITGNPQEEPINGEPLYSTEVSPDRDAMFWEMLTQLTEEARYVTSLVLKGDVDGTGPKQIKTNLKSRLREEGWSWPPIRRSFNEIRDALTELSA